MPAEVIRASTIHDRRLIVIACDGVQYQLLLKAAKDFNDQFIGYNAWLRKHNELYLSEEEAIAAGLTAVERINGSPAMAIGQGFAPRAAPAGEPIVPRRS